MSQGYRPPGKMVIDERQPTSAKARKPQKSRRKSIRVLVCILIALVLALIAAFIFIWSDVSKVWGDLGFDPDAELEEYELDPDAETLPSVTFNKGEVPEVVKPDGVTDILLIGVDSRQSDVFTGRSDVLMVVRVNEKTNEMKMVSFMRDTLVEIEDHDLNRLNTAYHFGSVELAYKTLAENYGVLPDYYMVVNFFGMEDIINAMDGVDVNMSADEVNHTNGVMNELNALDPGGAASYLSGEGMIHMNGRQAVSFMRVRKLDSDAGRIGRQQRVLQALFNKATKVSAGQVPGLIDTLSDYVRTDMPVGKMVNLAGVLLNMDGTELNSIRYPDNWEGGNYNGMSVVQPKDYDAEMDRLHEFLD